MIEIPESETMKELRKIKEELSLKLSAMTPEERVAYIHDSAVEFEQKYGLKLRHVNSEEEKSA